MNDFRYNYIIVGITGVYRAAYHDLLNMNNVSCHQGYVTNEYNAFVNLIFRINFNLRLNRFLKTPFRKIVFPLLYPHKFDTERCECYIFLEDQFAVFNTEYLTYLRKSKPGVKLVLYMQDIVASLPYYHIDEYKKEFDLILSYDRGDCERYGLLYYPTPYSYIDNTELVVNSDIDLFFCGASKNRYEKIIQIYEQCVKKGINCLFYITDVPIDCQVKGDGLVYNLPIQYEEYISIVKRSKCILEVMQDNADGFTMRMWESIFYGKHLLTNNHNIKQSEYFNSQSMHQFADLDRIDEWINKRVVIDSLIVSQKSPVSLLRKIEESL